MPVFFNRDPNPYQRAQGILNQQVFLKASPESFITPGHNRTPIMTTKINIVGNTARPLSYQANVVVLPPSPEESRKSTRRELSARIGDPHVRPMASPGTCQWILSDPEFQTWHTSSSKHLLWISGCPGKGKSHLAAYLCEHLASEATKSQSSPLVLQFSCEDTDIRRSTSLAVHLNILYQILNHDRSHETLHDDASSILNDVHTRFNDNLPRDDLWSIIKGFINGESRYDISTNKDHRTYFILDGLDECDSKSIDDLSKKLEQLCSTENRQKRRHFKAIVLTRPLVNISNPNLWINLDNDDTYGEQILDEIRLFIHHELQPILRTQKSKLETLKTILSERSNKTFLWVALALSVLKSRKSDMEVLATGRNGDVLDRLFPPGLESMYNRMLLEALRGKYDGLDNLDPKSCAKVIQYICVAYRPLTEAELRTAVDVSSFSEIISRYRHVLSPTRKEVLQEDAEDHPPNSTEDDTENASKRKVDEKTFQLVHLSLKEYLQQTRRPMIPAPLGFLVWPSLAFIVDILRIGTYRFYYLDHLLFAAAVLKANEFLKRYPILALILLAPCVHGLYKLRVQKWSWVLRALSTIFETVLGHCVHGMFAIPERKGHDELFLRSINFLKDKSAGLKEEDKINLSIPGALSARRPKSVDAHLDPFGQYACLFWAEHLYALCEFDKKSKDRVPHEELVLQFLEGYLLHWLRNLSLQNTLRNGVLSIKNISRIIEGWHNEPSGLEIFLTDTERFVSKFAHMIEKAPFQVYSAALVFSPMNSIVRSTMWKHVLPIANKIKTTEKDWSPFIQTLEGHSKLVTSVAFSRDGKLIASASVDKICLWDSETGWLNKTLWTDINTLSVAFCRRGNVVASGQPEWATRPDGKIRIWNAETGDLIKKFETKAWNPLALSCSLKNDTLAIPTMNSIQIWDFGTGDDETCNPPSEITEQDARDIRSLAFTPNGLLIASSSEWVKVWDVETRELTHFAERTHTPHANLRTPIGIDEESLRREHEARLDSLPFAVDKADTSTESTSRLCIPRAGMSSQPLIQHIGRRGKVALSPNCKIVASSHENGVRLWDSMAHSSRPEQAQKSHSVEHIASIIASPDGLTLAASHWSDTSEKGEVVSLWKVEAGALIPLGAPSFDDAPAGFDLEEIAFSPCSHLLALLLSTRKEESQQIRLWNVRERKETHVLNPGHFIHRPYRGFSLAFSPNAQTLASATDAGVMLWNLETGTLQAFLRGFVPEADITFSSDSRLVAFCTPHRGTVRHKINLWDCASGKHYFSLYGHKREIRALSLSSDGKHIASASDDETVRIWDTNTKESIAIINRNIGWEYRYPNKVSSQSPHKWDEKERDRLVVDLTFSLDGRCLITLGVEGTIRTWNMADGTLACARQLHTDQSHHQPFDKFALSKCGNYLTMNRGMVGLTPKSLCGETYLDGEWIVRDGKKVLWLPPDMRTADAVCCNDHLILMRWRESIEILQFSKSG